jgi:adenylate cyclase
VNLPSRMELHGQSGIIQITRSTHELVKDAFDCEAGGTIEVKGAGPMEVWHVIGRERADAGSGRIVRRFTEAGEAAG